MAEFSRIYVAGCGGMLGEAVHSELSRVSTVEASDVAPRAPWLDQLDVADLRSFARKLERFEPDLVVNLAALTDLEYCERHPDQAWSSNALGAENAARLAAELDVPCVFVSTAGIFGGEKRVFHDDDSPNPLTVYARSKYHGEIAVRRTAKHFVLRAGWMMGGGPELDKKFVNKVYAQIAAGADTIHAVTDKLGSPTFTRDFARGLLHIARNAPYGAYNQVCGGEANRYDVAVEFVRCLGLEGSVEVIPVGSEHFADTYFAQRPRSEQLVNDKLDALGLNLMRHWREALAEYADVFVRDLQSRATRTASQGRPRPGSGGSA